MEGLNMAVVERVRELLLDDLVLEAMQREYRDGMGGLTSRGQSVRVDVTDNQRWQDIVEAGLQKAGLS